ncbi:thiol oxidoreductase [Pseudoalteromonas sp. NBT06-2]|uniref:di-heme oxidoreductase family protein n=1 Tax=Pseudoalteromonas sp. NBT06-2 TaxID=2025950 RepID=UPI000BA56644|nr:di-heme oxidoredictase family protein [Pseudoalteromonas sp. NBT06-2]PAJ75813.1 thiol oxidoreductase [Pseudoalteromonas sp. NBT06-2]
MKNISLILGMIFLIGCGGGEGVSSIEPVIKIDDKEKKVDFIQFDDGLKAMSISKPDEFEYLSAGQATTDVQTAEAYGQAIPAIKGKFEKNALFKGGDHLFRNPHNGTGPLFNTATCQGCHVKDGRGNVPVSIDKPMVSMFLRISDAEGNPDVIYGNQLQTFGITGNGESILPKHDGAINENISYGEAYAFVEYETITGQYNDGESYQLRKPIYKVKDLSYGDFNETVRLSPRVSPPVFGTGLLESIPEEALAFYSDPDDKNKDGISGRAVYSVEPISNKNKITRFGYKATTTSILQQISGAYRGDMGITNFVEQQEPCTQLQVACLAQAQLEQNIQEFGLDLSKVSLAQVEFYNRTLSVPKRRGYDNQNNTWQPEVLAGRTQFFELNCNGCHVPRFKTQPGHASLLGDVTVSEILDSQTPISELGEHVIYPYTDLLLHDMGGQCADIYREGAQGQACESGSECIWVQKCEGLADNRPEGQATGTEWKTPALWGLGLVQTVNSSATLLHDGRARTIAEAILWHGGEAEQAKNNFIALPKEKRKQLLTFLESL